MGEGSLGVVVFSLPQLQACWRDPPPSGACGCAGRWEAEFSGKRSLSQLARVWVAQKPRHTALGTFAPREPSLVCSSGAEGPRVSWEGRRGGVRKQLGKGAQSQPLSGFSWGKPGVSERGSCWGGLSQLCPGSTVGRSACVGGSGNTQARAGLLGEGGAELGSSVARGCLCQAVGGGTASDAQRRSLWRLTLLLPWKRATFLPWCLLAPSPRGS